MAISDETQFCEARNMAKTELVLGDFAVFAPSTEAGSFVMRLPEGDVPVPQGAGVSKSATSRRFVALSAARMKEWMVSDLGHRDIMVVQIDGIHIAEDIVLVARSASTARAQSIHSGCSRARHRENLVQALQDAGGDAGRIHRMVSLYSR